MLTREFKKSSKSTVIQDCVEVALGDNEVVVRDSKNKSGLVLKFNHREWEAFVDGVREGEFDLP